MRRICLDSPLAYVIHAVKTDVRNMQVFRSSFLLLSIPLQAGAGVASHREHAPERENPFSQRRYEILANTSLLIQPSSNVSSVYAKNHCDPYSPNHHEHLI